MGTFKYKADGLALQRVIMIMCLDTRITPRRLRGVILVSKHIIYPFNIIVETMKASITLESGPRPSLSNRYSKSTYPSCDDNRVFFFLDE